MEIIEALLQRGVRLRSYDEGRHLTTCPQCSASRRKSREACFSVLIDAKGFVGRCHHCGWRSGWLQEKHGERVNAKFRIADEGNTMALAKPVGAVLSEDAREWLASRGILPEVAERYELWSERGALAFPFIDGGEIVNVQYRRWPKGFSMAPGGKITYFGLQHVAAEPETVVIVEGMMDTLACAVAGVTAISVPNGAATVKGDAKGLSYIGATWERLSKAKRIVLAVDGDAPGIALRDELARRYGRERCWFVEWPAPHKDANDLLMADGPAALAAAVEGAKPFPVRFLARMSEFSDSVMDLYQKGTARGMSTGFPSLDQYFTIRPGELTIVTGYPGHGKSSWIDQVLINVCRSHGQIAAVCSFENPPTEYAVKLIEKVVGRPFFDAPENRTPRATILEISNAIDWLDSHVFQVRLGEEAPTIDAILETARGAVGRYGINILVVDPYNEMARPTDLSLINETEYVSQMLGRLTRFAKSNAVHVFFVAHPRKPSVTDDDGQIGPPTLYGISGSQQFLNKTDTGIVIHRPSVYDTAVDVYVKKVRFRATGTPGSIALEFDRTTGIFYEPSEFDRETREIA